MSDDLNILFGFLKAREQEVSGRGSAPISKELREQVVRFAAGNASDDERQTMKKLLQEQPDLIPVLVAEVETLRGKGSS